METINYIYPLMFWFAIPWWLYVLFGGGLILLLPKAKEAAEIIIMGATETGKSTLWNKLNPKYVYNPHTRGGKEVESFEIKRTNGSIVTISKTKDFGGEYLYFRNFITEINRKFSDEKSKKNTLFIFYLIKSSDLNDNKAIKDTRARIKVIFDEFSDSINNKKLGFIIILTHFDIYCTIHNILPNQINDAKDGLKETLSKKLSGFKLTKSKKKSFKDEILIGNLNDQMFINEIKDIIDIKNENS